MNAISTFDAKSLARPDTCCKRLRISFQKPTPSSMPEMEQAMNIDRVGIHIVCRPPPWIISDSGL